MRLRSSMRAMLAATCIATPVGNAAWAQATPVDDGASSEIIVTGSRLREEAVQDAPVAVSVVTSRTIEDLHGTNLAAISAVAPNLQLNETATSPGAPSVSLRGFSTRSSDISTEPGIAVYVDGIYQSIVTGSMADLYDLERLEVLRGPQGTLLGKNAAAGAILLTRKRPKHEFSGRATVEYGSHNLIQVNGLVNFPIVQDVLAAKVFASFRSRDGWVKNLAVPGTDLSGEKRGSVRGALLFDPSSNFELYLTGDYVWDRSEQQGFRNVSDDTTLGCQVYNVCDLHTGQRRVSSATYLDKPRTDENNITANAKWQLGGVALTSLTGYRRYEQENHSDLDASPEPILSTLLQDFDVKQFSQELRLSSENGGGLDLGGRLNWLIAGYYGHTNAKMGQIVLGFGSPTSQSQQSIRETYAIFGHVDFKITDQWEVTFGARRSWDKVKHRFSLPLSGDIIPDLAFEDRTKFSNTSFEAGTSYEIAKGKMVYFRYAEGYRGGGFVGLPGSLATAAEFGPETSTSYEIGAKTDWLDGALRFNVTLFDVKFSDLQRDVVTSGPGGTFLQVTANAASASTKGVEVETVIQPIDDFKLSANFGYLDAKYKKYQTINPANGNVIDFSGLPLTFYSPKYTLSVMGEYTIPLNGDGPLGIENIRLQSKFDWRSKFDLSTTLHPVGQQKAYGVWDASIALEQEHGINLTFYVQNLLDKRFITIAENIGGLIHFQGDNIGRTFGVVLDYKF